MIKLYKNYAKIDTLNTTLLLCSAHGRVYKLYYGDKIKDDDSYLGLFDHNICDLYTSTDDTYYANTFMSSNGDGNNIESMVRITNEDSTFVSRFEFVNFKIVDINLPYNNFPHSLNKTEISSIYLK